MNINKFTVPQEEIEKQKEYTALAAELLSRAYPDESPKAYVHTYGCQGNVSDGERIKGMLDAAGYDFTDNVEEADLIQLTAE